MSDSYVECLVKAKQPMWAKILKVLLVTLTVLSCLVMFGFIIFLPVALVAGVGPHGSICTGLFLSSGQLQEPSGEGEGLQHRRGTSAGRSLCYVL